MATRKWSAERHHRQHPPRAQPLQPGRRNHRQTSRLEEGLAQGPSLRHAHAELLYQPRRQEPSQRASRRTRKSQAASLRNHPQAQSKHPRQSPRRNDPQSSPPRSRQRHKSLLTRRPTAARPTPTGTTASTTRRRPPSGGGPSGGPSSPSSELPLLFARFASSFAYLVACASVSCSFTFATVSQMHLPHRRRPLRVAERVVLAQRMHLLLLLQQDRLYLRLLLLGQL